MCDECVSWLQEQMDTAILKDPPQQLVLHLDEQGHGYIDTVAMKDDEFHRDGEFCWCRPLVIKTSETRTAAELLRGWYEGGAA